MTRFSKIAVTITVIAHLIVNLLHGRAHTELGVGLTSFQQFYVIAVILARIIHEKSPTVIRSLL
jgi:hypothetical protein